MNHHKFLDLALSAPTSWTFGVLSARPRADLEREARPLLWRECASTIIDS